MIEGMQTRAEPYGLIRLHDYDALDAFSVATVVPDGPAWTLFPRRPIGRPLTGG